VKIFAAKISPSRGAEMSTCFGEGYPSRGPATWTPNT